MSDLVWAVHDGIELAALVGMPYLQSGNAPGWREVGEDHPKVRAALKQDPAIEPPPEPDEAPAQPARRKGQTTKEQA